MRWLSILLVVFSGCVFAVDRVSVLALFPGKAMLQIDEARKVLSDGQTDSSGVRLIKATPREAIVQVNGEQQVLTLGNAVNARYARPSRQEIRLLKSGEAFFIDGLLNGQTMRMLVDTGATTVALSELHARKLGIPYVLEGQQTTVGTASGAAMAYGVKLKSLKVGNRQFSNVRAVVVQGESPRYVLLGMNVLREFEIEQQQNLMILRSRL